MDVKFLESDLEAINGGQWVDDIPGMGDLRIKVRGLQSEAYQNARNRRIRAASREDRTKNGLTEAAQRRITGEALAETVLLDWDGISDGGKKVKYDPKQALEWLTNPAFFRFYDAVVLSAVAVDNEDAYTIEDAAGN